MESCEWLHWHNSRMPFMQLLQNSFSQRTRNYNTNSPQQTTVFYGEFIPSLIPRLNSQIFVTLDNTGSARVAFRIWSAVYDKDPICKKFLNLTSSNSSDLLPTDNGNRLNAFACFSAERYSILYWYADNKIAHLCSLATARVGIPLFRPSIALKACDRLPTKICVRIDIDEIS